MTLCPKFSCVPTLLSCVPTLLSCVPTLLPHQPRHNAVNVDRTSDQFALSLTLSNIKVATLTLPRNGVDTDKQKTKDSK